MKITTMIRHAEKLMVALESIQDEDTHSMLMNCDDIISDLKKIHRCKTDGQNNRGQNDSF